MRPTLFAFTVGVLFAASAFAQKAQPPIFTPIAKVPAAIEALPERVRPNAGQHLQIDWPALRAVLVKAPLDSSGLPPIVLSLPLPDGSFQRFEILESPVMEPALAAQAPSIHTYIARGLDDPSCSARLDTTPHGFHALARSASGVFLIDPFSARDTSIVTSYNLRDIRTPDEAVRCLVGPEHGQAFPALPRFEPRTVTTLRTVRAAVACTGEYGLYQSQLAGHEPNADDPLAAVVTVINRVNLVYEADLDIHMNLVANNRSIMFFDPATDPYANGNDSVACLNANPGVINQRIGALNYDIGHVLTRIPGGVAYLASVCTGSKAGGVSGIPRGGDIDPVTALVVLHEMGHQFGAGHTFNGSVGRCLDNIMPPSAWEPGGGTTPMAYPGGCPVGNDPPGDNIVLFADPFFNSGSIDQVRAFLASGAANCAASAATSNNIPAFDSLPPATINVPRLTPFTLAAHATDADNDPLTYSWEQHDLGPQQPLFGEGSDDNGLSPLFRCYPPVDSGDRTFPDMETVLNGTVIPGERFPSFAPATRRFRVAARDNRPMGGGVAISPEIAVTIQPGDPFAVTDPLEASHTAAGPFTVRWSVGPTTQPPISVDNVRILLSIDDGRTFPYTLAGSMPNSGEASITLPALVTPRARVRVEPVGALFFTVSPRFTIALCLGDFNLSGGTPDDADAAAFFDAWNNGDPGADLNHSGGTPDDADIAVFFSHWTEGC